jgi:AroM protein
VTKLGVLTIGQPPRADRLVHELAHVVTADPYAPEPHGGVTEAATRAQESGAGVLFIDCFGFNLATRDTAAAHFAGAIVLARSMAARLPAEIA